MSKIRVGILFGGRSAEHEVSIQSAKSIYNALDKEKYEPVLFGITKKGQWVSLQPSTFLQIAAHSYQALPEQISPGEIKSSQSPIGLDASAIDVIFPVLHGPYGEDGSIQGYLKTLNIPFVGAGILGSAVGMDKDVMKRLLRDGGLRIGKFKTLRNIDVEKMQFSDAVAELGLPLFVKPANLGSSVGVSMVENEDDYTKAVKEAFRYDTKILIEEYIKGREIECSVLGNENPIASVAGEILPQKGFYDYSSKYLEESGAVLKIPAEVTEKELRQIQTTALASYKVLCCEGLARVDVFLTDKGEVYVNEINTIPGFTNISMYPKLWEQSGISYSELVDRLIVLALERHKRDEQLETQR